MSLLTPIDLPVLRPQDAEYEAATLPSGFGQYLGAKMDTGFDQSIAGRMLDRLTTPTPNDTTPQVVGKGTIAPAPNTVRQRRLTEDEWKQLKLDRPGLEYSSMTVEQANAAADAYDERRYRDDVIARYQGGLLGQAAGFGAQLVGGLPSPENFVPFVPEAVRAGMVARMGVIGGHALAGAADAAIGNAAADAVTLPDLASRGENVGVADFALDVALGAVTGGILGAGGGLLARGAERARAPLEAPTREAEIAANAVRVDGLQRQADALETAMGAVANDEPVQVGPILADAVPQIQERAARSIEAYHGSPFVFDKFSTDAIGTGEGAQAYGHGLYFAENRGVAEGYRKRLVADLQDNPEQWVVEESGAKTAEDAIAWIDNYIQEAEGGKLNFDLTTEDKSSLQDARNSIEKNGLPEQKPGALYKVDLETAQDRLLNYDKPLSEQSPHVQEAIAKAGLVAKMAPDNINRNLPPDQMTGGDLVRGLGADKAASDKLHAAGIDGIRYLDGNSRADGTGTHNYVVFDADKIRIREVNGKATAAEPPPHPSIVEAERTVKQAPPQTGVEEAARLTKEMGVEQPPELADVEAMRKTGVLTAADEASLQRAKEVVSQANGWAEAYDVLSSCVLRFGQ